LDKKVINFICKIKFFNLNVKFYFISKLYLITNFNINNLYYLLFYIYIYLYIFKIIGVYIYLLYCLKNINKKIFLLSFKIKRLKFEMLKKSYKLFNYKYLDNNLVINKIVFNFKKLGLEARLFKLSGVKTKVYLINISFYFNISKTFRVPKHCRLW
jgi:hypothetical protein